MSCDWDVRCLDCNTDHGFSDANHQSDLMLVVAKMGPTLAAMAPTIHALREASVSGVELLLGYDRWRVDFDWFAIHGHHRLTAVDEYGRCHDECGDYFSCGECKHQRKCRRAKGHAGGHADKRDPAAQSESATRE